MAGPNCHTGSRSATLRHGRGAYRLIKELTDSDGVVDVLSGKSG